MIAYFTANVLLRRRFVQNEPLIFRVWNKYMQKIRHENQQVLGIFWSEIRIYDRQMDQPTNKPIDRPADQPTDARQTGSWE